MLVAAVLDDILSSLGEEMAWMPAPVAADAIWYRGKSDGSPVSVPARSALVRLVHSSNVRMRTSAVFVRVFVVFIHIVIAIVILESLGTNVRRLQSDPVLPDPVGSHTVSVSPSPAPKTTL